VTSSPARSSRSRVPSSPRSPSRGRRVRRERGRARVTALSRIAVPGRRDGSARRGGFIASLRGRMDGAGGAARPSGRGARHPWMRFRLRPDLSRRLGGKKTRQTGPPGRKATRMGSSRAHFTASKKRLRAEHRPSYCRAGVLTDGFLSSDESLPFSIERTDAIPVMPAQERALSDARPTFPTRVRVL
jgi:hypothetical protein